MHLGKIYMSDKVFVDTNVLIYAHDVNAREKHLVTRKIPRPLSKESARLVVSSYAVWCIDTTPGEISTAFQIEDESNIAFWDALIVASALKSGATRILSEDFNPGQMIAGVRIENPFAT